MLGKLTRVRITIYRRSVDVKYTTVAVVLLLESVITAFAFHGFYISVIDHEFSSVVGQGTGFVEFTPDPLWSFVALSPLTGTGESLPNVWGPSERTL